MENKFGLVNIETKSDRELLILTAQSVNTIARLQKEVNGQVKINTRNIRDIKIVLVTVCVVVGILFGREIPTLLYMLL